MADSPLIKASHSHGSTGRKGSVSRSGSGSGSGSASLSLSGSSGYGSVDEAIDMQSEARLGITHHRHESFTASPEDGSGGLLDQQDVDSVGLREAERAGGSHDRSPTGTVRHGPTRGGYSSIGVSPVEVDEDKEYDEDDAAGNDAREVGSTAVHHIHEHAVPSGVCASWRMWWRWLKSWFIPGMGMFSEAYVLFAVGNIQAIFLAEYPSCWQAHEDCPASLLNSITYTQVLGIIAGMLVMSAIADHIGRRIASIGNAACMFAGVLMLTTAYSADLRTQFSIYTTGLFIFGVGVGGEYPVASAIAAEEAELASSHSALTQPRRGRAVMLVFSMQGAGTVVNALVFLILLKIFGQDRVLDPAQLDWVWRLQYALGTIMLGILLVYRFMHSRDPALWVAHRAAQGEGTSLGRKLRGLFRHYWPRLIGTGMGWFVWDVCFYGNRLFQGDFIEVVEEDPSLFVVMEWTLVNAAVALVGYYAAAYAADKPWMGRLRMQVMGFLGIAICFSCSGFWYPSLRTDKYIHIFQTLYYFSSFIGQLGPNATTWLLPSELFPTEFRAVAHGLSSACGKAGALAAGILFSYMDLQTRLIVCGICGVIGLIVTIIFVADVTTLDLRELDAMWHSLKHDAGGSYNGAARAATHLSLYERCTRRHGYEAAQSLV